MWSARLTLLLPQVDNPAQALPPLVLPSLLSLWGENPPGKWRDLRWTYLERSTTLRWYVSQVVVCWYVWCRPGRYHQNTYHDNFTKLSWYRYFHNNSEGYVTCTKMHDVVFSWKRSILTFSGSRHTLLWFMMYPAKLKARSEGTDVAGIHRYFLQVFAGTISLYLN